MACFIGMGSEGLLAFQSFKLRKKDDGKKRLPLSGQVDTHRGIMTLSLVMLLGGFAAIYTAKNFKRVPHFATDHAFYGYMIIMWAVGQMVFGALAFNLKFPRIFHKMHGLSGTVLLMCASILAFYTQIGKPTSWFTSAANGIPFSHIIPFPQIASIATAASGVLIGANYMLNRSGRA
ncbi:hypothetical protein BASA50_006671 [Batrachochytrium salamandrivorans]|uniref:Cytochrome b561 domain-containing protein n=1 Tax=Batrachochytrium salamandrivorans TaxID=1357716 RepID=A0ABQ8F9T9_9FUNG|nr:hypothetical protein BASA62_010007 [Batrachochytrium salamandrivorans]KAH6594424.1 hypothetical protein BASA50_006671 [Batrachochytrium salamandrivorans]KAH9274887.1 hypothetical protein BASA83_002599 [Batrachochytrium salamandrivorans]